MWKRVSVLAAVGIATVFALPTLALGDETESTETNSTETTTTTTEVGSKGTEVSVVTEEPIVEEESTETETTSDEIEPGTTSTATSSTTTSSAAATSTASTQSTLTTAKKSSGKKKKGRKAKKSGKRCSASSRGGGQLAQASDPPAPGCVRLNGGNGQIVLPDGTTLSITETSQGHISFTVSGGPTGTFTGTIFVKGGPSSPGNSCTFDTPVAAGSCETFTNDNGKNFGVSHVDACPGVPPEQDTPEEKAEGKEKQKKVASKKKQEQKKQEPTFVASETVTPQGETLPFTGLPVAWLLIVGAGLISGGLAVRRSP